MKKIIIFIVILIALGIANAQINVGSVNNDWHVTGNVARTTDYLGTKNNVDLTFKAGSDTKLILYTNDSVRIPNLTNKPFLQLDANGYLTNANTGKTNGYFWGLKGNTGTNPNVHFIGTIDNVGLNINTNATSRIHINSSGQVGINGQPYTFIPYKLQIMEGGEFIRSTNINFNNSLFKIQADFGNFPEIFEARANGSIAIGKGSIRQDSYLNFSVLNTEPKTYILSAFQSFGSYLHLFSVSKSGNVNIGTDTANDKLNIDSGIANDSGLSFLKINSTTPSSINAKTLGVNASGKVVTMSNAITVNQTAVKTSVTQTVLGNQNFKTPGTGFILKSPNGSRYLITVNDDGTLKSQKVN